MIAMTSLSACGTAGSDHVACPPVVEYPAALQERAAVEIEALSTWTAELARLVLLQAA